MADKKVSELTTLNTASGDDLLLVVNDPSGTPDSRKITVNNLFGNVVVSTTHKAATTFEANTFVRGTVCTVSANVNITAGLSVNTVAILPAIEDRLQVANAAYTYAPLSGAFFTGPITTQNNIYANTLFLVADTGLKGTPLSAAPVSNNTTTEGWTAGTIAFSNTYLYIAVDANTIKRVPLQVF